MGGDQRFIGPRATEGVHCGTVREAAQPLGISERLPWNLMRDGRVPVLRLGVGPARAG